MGALSKAATAANKGKTIKPKTAKKAGARTASPKALLARGKRAIVERRRNQAILSKFEEGVPVHTLSKNYKLTHSAVYQRLCRARNAQAVPSKAVALVRPTLVAAAESPSAEISEMTQVAFLRGRIQQLEAMLKQVLTMLGARKLTAG